MSKRRKILYFVMINAALIVFFEVASRLVVQSDFLYSKVGFIFELKSSRFSNSEELTEFEQTAFCDRMHKTDYGNTVTARELAHFLEKEKVVNQSSRDKIWAFGGSTTFCRTCSNTFSWPSRLEKELPNVDVDNFGLAQMNSDYSLDVIKKKIIEEQPSVVLWANWFNEVNICSWGPANNKNELERQFPLIKKTTGNFNRISYYIKSVSHSLIKYSTFYLACSVLVDKVLGFVMDDAVIIPRWVDQFPANVCPIIVLENYRLNFLGLLELQKKYQFKIVIIRLPFIPEMYFERKMGDSFYTDSILRNYVMRASNENDRVYFFDLQQRLIDQGLIIPFDALAAQR